MEEPLQLAKPLEAKDFIKANVTLWVWLIFLTLGGSLLALYYARIRYLPDIEWSSSIIYLAVASIIGGSVGLLLSLSLFIPGFLWDEFLICDSKLIGVFCYKEDKKREASVLQVFWLLGFPFVLVLLVSHVALLLGIMPYLVISLVGLMAGSFLMWYRFKRLMQKTEAPTDSGEVGKQQAETQKTQRNDANPGGDWQRTCKYTFWFGLSILLRTESPDSSFSLNRDLLLSPSDTRLGVVFVNCFGPCVQPRT